MSKEQNDLITIDMVFGTVELQQRPVIREDGALGSESRSVHRDLNGGITKIGEWSPPCCWLVFPEPESPRRWWEFWR
jgi:hypothetical protein